MESELVKLILEFVINVIGVFIVWHLSLSSAKANRKYWFKTFCMIILAVVLIRIKIT